MNTENTQIPAALPVSEAEDEREQIVNRFNEEDQSIEDDLITDQEEDEGFDETEEQNLAKPSKKKLFLAFTCFVFGFVMLIALLSWFFGIGVFAATKTQAVDRTAKNASGATNTAPASEEEKLKMALNLVAEKEKTQANNLADAGREVDVLDNQDFNSSVDIPSTKATDVTEPLIIPDASSNERQNQVNSSISPSNVETSKPQSLREASVRETVPSDLKSNRVSSEVNNTPSTSSSLGRSLFFGIDREKKVDEKTASPVKPKTKVTTVQDSTKISKSVIPFGTLLPVRLLGAVNTLQGSGGLVRMELTRQVKGKNYSYPAGTVLVGKLRGSEHKRAFISVIGLIDPKTGGLVKFKGEVMGTDGASGVVGRRRNVKSTWSRVLGGLRDAGATALGAISGGRSGGTVIISDSASRASQELSGLVGDKRRSVEFVEIPAGTHLFVQVTDLPEEVSNASDYSQNELTKEK